MIHRKSLCAAVLLASTALLSAAGRAQSAAEEAVAASSQTTLDQQFLDPPQSARPRVWWHWMNGNITKDGIARDLAWMKRIGIGGVQSFDANLQTPQIVDHRLIYMTPEWKDAFRFAAREADRLDLELAIAASPGWSETGGPWVKPADGLKKLVWSQVDVAPGKRPAGALPMPPGITGPFQDLAPGLTIEELISGHGAPAGPSAYGEVGVFAYPVAMPEGVPVPEARDSLGNRLDAAKLADATLGEGVTLARKDDTTPGLRLDFGKPVTMRSATVFLPGVSVPFAGSTYTGLLEVSTDGATWSRLADVTLGTVPSTIGFAPVTGRHFRLVLNAAPPRPSLGAPAPGAAMGGIFEGMAAMMKQRPLVVGSFALKPEALVDRFETKAGFVMSPDYYALAAPQDAAHGAAPLSVIDLGARMKSDGTLAWKAPKLPKGHTWRVVRMGWSLLGTTNHPAPPEATGLEVDKYDGPAVRAYLEHYLGMYKEAAGADMIGKRGVRALLTDSIEVGEANWTPRMLDQFQRLRGYDARPWLPALTGALIGTRADTDRFLYDYRRTLADLLASQHYGMVAKVAHENDLIVYGEALEDRRPMLGDDMAMRAHADVPMSALWTFDRKEGPRQTLIADMKGAASVAHLYGQNLVAAESMTAAMAPWAFAPKDLKRFIDLEFASGINRPVIHTSVHVPVEDKKPGLSLFIFGQYFNRNESWAPLAKPWVDYIARSSLLLQKGRNVADLAYFHGEEAPLTGLYADNPVADAPVANAFDFLNFGALTELLTNDGSDVVSPAGARYKAIYLGGTSRMMTLPALQKLALLVEGGATLIGAAPQADPGLASDSPAFAALVARLWPGGASATVGKGRVIAATNAAAGLAAAGVAPDFAFTGGTANASIPFVHRLDGDADIYFLVNQQEAAEQVEARFRVTGKQPELWNAKTGTSKLVSYRIVGNETIVPLTFEGEEAVFVVFRQPAAQTERVVAAPAIKVAAMLDDSWSLAFEAGRGAPATAKMAKLVPLETSQDPGLRYFSGIATYTRTFTAPRNHKPGRALWLDLGAVGDLAQVSLNGVDVGTAWHAPYRLDISKAVRKGSNTLEIRVANTWVNRLVGDAQPGAVPITWTAMPTYRADAPLRPSGLIGPVRLLESAN